MQTDTKVYWDKPLTVEMLEEVQQKFLKQTSDFFKEGLLKTLK